VTGANYATCNSGLLYGLFPYFGKGFDGISGVEAYGFRPFHEFDDFDQLLARLDIGNVVLSTFQAFGEINLA
jgi:hypothetical protein